MNVFDVHVGLLYIGAKQGRLYVHCQVGYKQQEVFYPDRGKGGLLA